MKFRPIESLPLFSDDAAIGLALLGPGRAREWKCIAQLFELRGLPKIDALNPVVARHLAACILKMGQGAGWLDERADVICPPFSGYDA